MSADLALQKAVRARLVQFPSVTALVPAASILDRNARPAPDPSIIIGEGQAVEYGDIAREVQRCFLTLHLWKKETGLVGVKAIAGAIRAAVHAEKLVELANIHFGDCRVTDVRYMRDPGGEYAHAVVTIEALVSEISS